MAIGPQALTAIRALYDAALDESRWTHALGELARGTNSQAATLWMLDGGRHPRLPLFTYINFDPAFVGEYLEHYAQIDPTVRYLVGHPAESIVHDGRVIGQREKDRHPYYDWHRRGSDTEFRLVGQVSPAKGVQAGVALHRTRRAWRYEPEEVDHFSLLYEHVERALTIAFRLGSLSAMHQWSVELLDRSPVAIVLLDREQRLIYSNHRAELVLAARDGLVLSGQRVGLLDRRDNRTFGALVTRALAGEASAAETSGMMRVRRPSGKRPYGLVVMPIGGRYPELSILRPAVCLFISDPDADVPLPHERLRAVFGLTEAEARLAERLATGEELRTAAEHLGITYGTARARLAEIFQKTNTRRQAELVKLLLTTMRPP